MLERPRPESAFQRSLFSSQVGSCCHRPAVSYPKLSFIPSEAAGRQLSRHSYYLSQSSARTKGVLTSLLQLPLTDVKVRV